MEVKFSRQFSEKLKYQILLKSVRWEPNCYIRTRGRAGGRTDMTKLKVVVRNLVKGPKIN